MARFSILPERSRVVVDARSSLHPIHADTSGLEGYIDLELTSDGDLVLPDTPVARLVLDARRLSSGNRFEDRELHRRIDVRRYPRIEGVLSAISSNGERGHYLVRGDVVFRGVTCSHEDEMWIEALDEDTVHLEGRSRFDIRAYGMEPPRILTMRVEPEVEVAVDIVATRKG